MSEIESPVEHLSEEIHEVAEQAKENWLKLSALLSAIFAVMAAIAGLQSGHEENEAMILQIQSSDAWGYYQAKGIKAMITEMQPVQTEATKAKFEKYKKEQEEIKKEADAKSDESKAHLAKHEIVAKSVTLFQIAIAITAISVLTRRKRFLLFALAIGVVGAWFFAQYWI